MIYFDARLSDRYPTVELRVADVCLNVADTVLIASLARALVETAVTSWRHHAPAPTVPTGLIRMASWRAARSGLDGKLLDPLTSRPHGGGGCRDPARARSAGPGQRRRPRPGDRGLGGAASARDRRRRPAGLDRRPRPRRDGSPGRGSDN